MDEEHNFSGSLYTNCSLLSTASNFIVNETDCSNTGPYDGSASSINAVASMISQISLIFVFLVGFSGNTLVIYVVLSFSKMQTVTNRYILNLAIADELFMIGIPFLAVTAHLEYWVFGSTLTPIKKPLLPQLLNTGGPLRPLTPNKTPLLPPSNYNASVFKCLIYLF